MSIKHNGKIIKVTRFEAIIRKLYADAFTGDRKAQAELLRMRLKYARAKKAAFDDDDTVQPFALIIAGQQVSEGKPTRKPRTTIRRRKAETHHETFNRVSVLTVTVSDSGVRRRMTFEHALWQMIMAGALGGDIAATRLITRYMDVISECHRQNQQMGADDDEPQVFTLDLGKLPGLDDDDEDWGNDPEPVA